MDIKQFILLSVLYYWASSTSLSLGVGYYTMYRPVIAGYLTGLILGDPFTGMTAGAAVNIIYINFVSTGGSFKGDQCLTAMIAALVTILLGLSPLESSAAAYPFGFLGTMIWKYRLNINSVFVKEYEKKFAKGKSPSIEIYDGFLPQILLLVMSTIVIFVAVFATLFFKNFIINIRHLLFLLGLFLIFSSSWNILYKLQSKRSYLFFLMLLIITLLANPSSCIFFIIALAIVFLLSNKKLLLRSGSLKTCDKNKKIRKIDLIYSWFVWMNFSHSCYSYERLQGMALAHSMRNIFKRLYTDKDEIKDSIRRHSELFNTEPNIGTPILGYIISLEELKQGNTGESTDEIMSKKRGMMGIAAGLGDSYTQVVLTPLFISMSVMMCFDSKFIVALVPAVILAISILIISYTGFMKGYYEGRDSMVERINIIKNSRVKAYFPYIFAGILGVSLGKLLIMLFSEASKNLTIYMAVGIISIVYTMIKNKRRN